MMERIDVTESIEKFIDVLGKVVRLGVQDSQEQSKRERSGNELAQRYCLLWHTSQEKAFRIAWKAGRVHADIGDTSI